ncbi:hypothetical protein HNR46_003346 [Haloferula luteola]|uniref:Non-reducing end beta-L-arabinofuranosidase n=1 Tax=Haloferula luteola TaxID=595692 RepID=A0A840V618_9BACT|nr:glycoside hydrolase family 127 protein [Haloferula luteola]MBB5353093.1 hypothetical protein [Haloferula luteola]
MHFRSKTLVCLCGMGMALSASSSAAEKLKVDPSTPVELFPLSSVRVLEGPFAQAVEVNRRYLLALDPDRLLAPFRREAGLPAKAESYENWENTGLDGHTAGHYLAALANMIAAGDDADHELRKRLDHMLDELELCQIAAGNGYLGGVPGSREFWGKIAAGDVEAIWSKWVPWYNVHKTFAGLRDVYLRLDEPRARELLVHLGDWCVDLISGISDEGMQRMLRSEYGGMNETLADIYAITGEAKYLEAARRFGDRGVFEPLFRHEDRLTGLHANTQIPKIIGMERIAALTNDGKLEDGARFFWETVTEHRNVAFGGNSVAEHFNDPKDFRGMLEHREGPETCNTYNMLRLTEQLFERRPEARLADYYERALFNHILASIHPKEPGFVYFTPIRPEHYRVYSEPEHCFWCCVGTGMENPGKYGEFIYAKAKDGVFVNLFIPSELKISDRLQIRQETAFPNEQATRLKMELKQASTFTLYLRHPRWVASEGFQVTVNGEVVETRSAPSSYLAVRREWHGGDVVELRLPMETSVERLPDGSDWVALLHGPIVLASPSGKEDLKGLHADGTRMGHVAWGPEVPLDQVPVLLTSEEALVKHVQADPQAGPMHFRLSGVVDPARSEGLSLQPFYTLHESRYQMYWELTSREKVEARRSKLAAQEREKAAREAATVDQVTAGEQQPEVEHDLKGEGMETGLHNGRRWRHGQWIQYTLRTHGEKDLDLVVTYWGGDSGRQFDILVGGTRLATQELKGEAPDQFIEKRYPIPAEVLASAKEGKIDVRFEAKVWLAGGIFDLRLMKPTVGE